MTLRILPLGNGFAVLDADTRHVFSPWFVYDDAARVFRQFVQRGEVTNEAALATAIEAYLTRMDEGLDAEIFRKVLATTDAKYNYFLLSPEYAAFERKAAA